ncbi:L-threonylcarbamoyladenylate synthase [Georgenia sp. Z1491]|uniref:L-threonylcarbamoyladenylate synthase n=1 Tax=Georgenia sp. Z1491 TaxID=3416707 RepID=UPI003CF6B73F
MVRHLDIHPTDPQPRKIAQAVDVLRQGGLVAYPTDSGYALGATPGNKDAIERITQLRRLDKKHHFTLVCHDFAQLGSVVIVDNSDFRLIKSLTPGPYTFILTATKEVPRMMVHPKKLTVGVRIPDHPVSLALVRELGEPILSSTLILPDAEEPMSEGWVVAEEIGHALDAVVDSDVTSTEPTSVLDLSEGDVRVARVGAGDVSRFE